MNRSNYITMGVLLIAILAFVWMTSTKDKGEEINLMTWGGDFIPRVIIDEFTEETGIKVNYKEVTSNEDMQSLLEANPDQYDLAVVTDYMVDILRQTACWRSWTSQRCPMSRTSIRFTKGTTMTRRRILQPVCVSTSFLLVNPEAVARASASDYQLQDLWQRS